MKQLLIFGGYGNAGKLLSSCLLRYTRNTRVIIAGRDMVKAGNFADKLKILYPVERVSHVYCNAFDKNSIIKALKNVDMIVVAASSLHFVRNIAEAAIETQTDYYDIQLSLPHKNDYLRSIESRILSEERTFITDGGYHPGVPGAMIHWSSQQLAGLETANIYAALRMNWRELKFSSSTISEMLEEFEYFDNSVYENNEWKKPKWSESTYYDFEDNFHELQCTPMMMEEIKLAPDKTPGLKNTAFYISGFNKFVDYFLLPIIWFGVKYLPSSFRKPLGGLFRWGLRFGKPPFGVKLVSECSGKSGSCKLQMFHEDGYLMTVIPVVACLKQYLKGTIPTGLHLQAWAVNPDNFFDDISEMGIDVKLTVSNLVPVS